MSSLLNDAPPFINKLYAGLNGYVREKLYPPARFSVLLRRKTKKEIDDKKQWMKNNTSSATVIVLIFLLYKQFIRNSEMIDETLDVLNDLGVKEFSIGKTKFEKGNENVMAGRLLAESLLMSIEQDVILKKIILDSTSVVGLINRCKECYKW